MTPEEKNLREIREAAGVGAGYSHEDLVILVRNAVPKIAHALELTAERDALRGEVAGLQRFANRAKRLLDQRAKGFAWFHLSGLPSLLRNLADYATNAGKPEAEVLSAAKKQAAASRDDTQSWAQWMVLCGETDSAVERMEEARRLDPVGKLAVEKATSDIAPEGDE